MSEHITPTIVWVRGEGGDGKSTLSRQMGAGLVISTDWYACASIDTWVDTNPELAQLWDFEQDLQDEGGFLRRGNLAIGGFWRKATDGGFSEFLAHELVKMVVIGFRSQFKEVAVIEGWLPDELHEACVDRLLKSGFRVWEMSRRK